MDDRTGFGPETVTQEGATAVTGTKNVRYTYNALSRRLTVEDDNGQLDGENPDYDFTEVEYVYDWQDAGTDQYVEETHTFNGSAARTAKSTITAVGVRSTLLYPNNRTIGFTHDELNRLSTVTEGGNTIGDYTYKGLYLQDRGLGNDNGSRVVKLTFKDQADLDGYDAWGRIKWMKHYKVAGAVDIAKLTYGHDRNSNRLYRENTVTTDKDELYAYDRLDRLTMLHRGDLDNDKDDGRTARRSPWKNARSGILHYSYAGRVKGEAWGLPSVLTHWAGLLAGFVAFPSALGYYHVDF